MTERVTLYRPEWTCGRYNDKQKVAIYYNLLEGMAYFFEEYSAVVVGKILSVEKNKPIDIEQIMEKVGLVLDILGRSYLNTYMAHIVYTLSGYCKVTNQLPLQL